MRGESERQETTGTTGAKLVGAFSLPRHAARICRQDVPPPDLCHRARTCWAILRE